MIPKNFRHQRRVKGDMSSKIPATDLCYSAISQETARWYGRPWPMPSFEEIVTFEPELYGARLRGDRTGICERLGRVHGVDKKGIFLANGVSDVITDVLAALMRSRACRTRLGGLPMIYVEEPSYRAYKASRRFLGQPNSRFRVFRRSANTEWKIVLPDSLEDECIVLVTNPHNPSGVYQDLEDVAKKVAAVRGTLVVDEIFRRTLPSIKPSASKLSDAVVAIDSLSKADALGCLRFGWAASKNLELIKAAFTCRDANALHMSSPALLLARPAILDPTFETQRADTLNVLWKNRDAVSRWIQRDPRFYWVPPTGGTICFVKLPDGVHSKAFCANLLSKEGIRVSPGHLYDDDSWIRLWLGGEPSVFEAALEALSRTA